MDFLHRELTLGSSDVVEVTLDNAANVQLLDEANYEHYRKGEPYRYHGGFATERPFRIRPPHGGRWHLVVDLGGNAGQVRAWTRILSDAEAPVG